MRARMIWRSRLLAILVSAGVFSAVLGVTGAPLATAAGFPQSENIALVPNASGRQSGGGVFPTSGFPDGYSPTFTDVPIEAIRDDLVDPIAGNYDTVLLNSICDIGAFLADGQFKSRIEAFVSNGGKLLIWDSECLSTDYSQFALPFQTNNPGQLGAQGTLVDTEENTLSSTDPSSPYFVDVDAVATGTDAVGDANVFTTFDPGWFEDLRATNANGVDGPAQAYANLGSGLIVYNGLDKDFLPGASSFDPSATDGTTHLNRIWLLELLQPWNPDGLPNSNPVAGCGDAVVIGVRGSGDNDHPDYVNNRINEYPGRHAIEVAHILQVTWGLKLFDDDGHTETEGGDEIHVIGLRYPAVSVTNSEVVKYGASHDAGVNALIAQIERLREPIACGTSTPILLVGFSQGAHVIQSTLERLDDAFQSSGDTRFQSIAGVGLLASPRFDSDDPVGRGTYVASYPNDGFLGGARIRSLFQLVTGSYCLHKDPVCNGGGLINSSVHTEGYNPGNLEGQQILQDVAGLLAWGVNARVGKPADPSPVGTLAAYKAGGNKYRVSAAAVYARGAPTSSFMWDFTSNGTIDQTTVLPFVLHDYGPPAGNVSTGILVTAYIRHLDGTLTVRSICFSRLGSKPPTCT